MLRRAVAADLARGVRLVEGVLSALAVAAGGPAEVVAVPMSKEPAVVSQNSGDYAARDLGE